MRWRSRREHTPTDGRPIARRSAGRRLTAALSATALAITATITSFMLTTGDPTSAGQRLRELADLHDSGLLTDEEYAAKRTKAVDRV